MAGWLSKHFRQSKQRGGSVATGGSWIVPAVGLVGDAAFLFGLPAAAGAAAAVHAATGRDEPYALGPPAAGSGVPGTVTGDFFREEYRMNYAVATLGKAVAVVTEARAQRPAASGASVSRAA